MAVKEFAGGVGGVLSSSWTDGTNYSYPVPGDQLVLHGAGDLAYAGNADLGSYYVNLGAQVPQYSAPTLSLGNSSANVYLDWLRGPKDTQDQSLAYRVGNVAAWGQYDVLNIGDYSQGGGVQSVITTSQGTTLYSNQQTVGGEDDTIYFNGGGMLYNYGVSNLYRTSEFISIPEIGNGKEVLNYSRMEFNNVYVASSNTIELGSNSTLVVDSPISATHSAFQGQIFSAGFGGADAVEFNGPVFNAASFDPTKQSLTLSLGDFKQSFNLSLKTDGGGPNAAFDVYQTYSGVAVVPAGSGGTQGSTNLIYSYTPQHS